MESKKVTPSEFLRDSKPVIKLLVSELRRKYQYVSVLGTDVGGRVFIVSDRMTSAEDNMWVERGFVVRLYSAGRYFEYAFNRLPDDVSVLAARIDAAAAEAFASDSLQAASTGGYPPVDEQEITQSRIGEVKLLPSELTSQQKIERLNEIRKNAHTFSDLLVDVRVRCSTTHLSKIFISDKKDLEQSYIFSEAYIVPVARRGDVTKTSYFCCSGLKGMEILDELSENAEQVVNEAVMLLDSKNVEPGEYEIICSPGAVGIIAHEAFGHGVEMDMFVKNRAKAVEYLQKPVASKVVRMHDGAAAAAHVSSYLFDDEGTLGTDTLIIEDGILKAGISDLLSALRLGVTPTGNGKRQSFENKAYTRMTNTFFERGTDKLDDMIKSVKHGYLIEKGNSGMEDPKDWGIQVMFSHAEEIIDGRLTGSIVAPVIMTGYVPELLSNISMVSDDFTLEGGGACGKGWKEWVKVSDGGPYIKTKARLG